MYSKAHLQDTGVHTGQKALQQGKVKKLTPIGGGRHVAHVSWNDGSTGKVHTSNLEKSTIKTGKRKGRWSLGLH